MLSQQNSRPLSLSDVATFVPAGFITALVVVMIGHFVLITKIDPENVSFLGSIKVIYRLQYCQDPCDHLNTFQQYVALQIAVSVWTEHSDDVRHWLAERWMNLWNAKGDKERHQSSE